MSNSAFLHTPKSLTSGDTLTWEASIAEYPASAGWVLHYTLINASNQYQIDAIANGADHQVNTPASTTANYVPGQYKLSAWVDGVNSQRYTLGVSDIEILPNLAAQVSGYDSRSPAKKCLDELNAALSTYGNKAYMQEYAIGDRRMRFNTPSDFMAFRDKVKAEVFKEKQAENIRLGKPAGSKVLVRY